MNPLYFGIAALGVLIVAAIYCIRSYTRPAPARPHQGYAAAPAPARAVNIIDAYDAAGRDAAARHVEEALGKHRAKRFAQDINEALLIIERPAGAAAATPPPAPNA